MSSGDAHARRRTGGSGFRRCPQPFSRFPRMQIAGASKKRRRSCGDDGNSDTEEEKERHERDVLRCRMQKAACQPGQKRLDDYVHSRTVSGAAAAGSGHQDDVAMFKVTVRLPAAGYNHPRGGSRQITLELEGGDYTTVAQLQNILKRKPHIPIGQLQFCGEQLHDRHQLLHYRVRNGSKLNLIRCQ
jgi:hypothetical protein